MKAEMIQGDLPYLVVGRAAAALQKCKGNFRHKLGEVYNTVYVFNFKACSDFEFDHVTTVLNITQDALLASRKNSKVTQFFHGV